LITGTVSDDGVPEIALKQPGRNWFAIIDTGFNGDLELPIELKNALPHHFIGRFTSVLAGGQRIKEDAYLVEIVFDGELVEAEANFVPGDGLLIGTGFIAEIPPRSHVSH
jgi:predicted aspartyl protease